MERIMSMLKKIIGFVFGVIGDFVGPAANSIKGHLNIAELVKVAISAVAAGGGVMGILNAALPAIGLIFPLPQDAALASMILTAIGEVIRRLSHGTPPPSPSPVPAPTAKVKR
jgi:hypothetical protein